MDFDLNEEQVLLKDAIDKFVGKEYGFEQRRAYQKEVDGWSRSVWAQLAEQGFLALPFDASVGGLDYGSVEMMLVMEALGRALLLEPYLTSIVVAGNLLQGAATPAQREALVPGVIAGDLIAALASSERQSRYSLNDVATHARVAGSGYALSGTKILVMHGGAADHYIVSARVAGERRDHAGISLFLVPANAPGLRRRTYRTQDGLQAADLVLDEVVVSADDRIGAEGEGLPILERTREFAIAALAAESVGAMQAMLDMTVDYLQQRTQFGTPIGKFQALQHRAAEMLIELEQARSMAIYAALMINSPDVAERARAMSAIKAQIGNSARVVGQLAVQLHGGVGVSEEYAVGHYFRRLTMIEVLFGDVDFHMERLASFAQTK